MPRNNFYDQNWRGSGIGEHPKKLGPPIYLFMQPLKLATSNLVYNLGLWSSLPRNNFYDQNWQGPGYGIIQIIWEPLFISATVEASNFKFFYITSIWGVRYNISTLVPTW